MRTRPTRPSKSFQFGLSRLLSVVVVCGLLAACRRTAPPAQPETTATPESMSTHQDVAAQWAVLIEAAQTEGEVVIAAGSSRSRDHRQLFEEFTRRYGVKVIAGAGSGAANVQRVLVERSRGRYTTDVSLVGATSSERLREAGALTPLLPLLIHPEAVDRSRGWHVTDHVWLDVEGGYVAATSFAVSENLADIYFNTEKVSAEELASLRSWQDFLKPEWRGRIVAILEPSGEGKMLQWTRCWRVLGKDWFARFMREAEPTLLPNGSLRAMADGLARGKYHVAFFVSEASGELEGMEQINLPVRKLRRPLAEGGGIDYGGSISVFDRAPHPSAARLFVNWYMTREGQNARQTLLEGDDTNPSLRSDVVQGKVSDYEWAQIQALQPEDLGVRGTEEWVTDVAAVTTFVRKLSRELGHYGD